MKKKEKLLVQLCRRVNGEEKMIKCGFHCDECETIHTSREVVNKINMPIKVSSTWNLLLLLESSIVVCCRVSSCCVWKRHQVVCWIIAFTSEARRSTFQFSLQPQSLFSGFLFHILILFCCERVAGLLYAQFTLFRQLQLQHCIHWVQCGNFKHFCAYFCMGCELWWHSVCALIGEEFFWFLFFLWLWVQQQHMAASGDYQQCFVLELSSKKVCI